MWLDRWPCVNTEHLIYYDLLQFMSLYLSGGCHEDVAASTSRRHAGLSIARRLAVATRKAEVERAQIILNCSQPGLPWSSSSSSPIFGRTPIAGPETSAVVLTGVGTAQMTKEGQAPLTDSIWQERLSRTWLNHIIGDKIRPMDMEDVSETPHVYVWL